ncbi:MAG TPA: acetyl-CoA carboxylase biotin carboxyl carrier protein [Methylomirabilota bacterium]|nr:acetyl-CoA carboxylase biotin carboxyl carrier protein [Methylomirabilota bacterium]
MAKKQRRPSRTTDARTADTTAPDTGSMVEQVVELATRFGLAELEVEENGRRVRVVRQQAPVPLAPPAPTGQVVAAVTEEPVPAHLIPIEAPMVGTFYRASSPDAPPFVNEGDLIKEGQVLCIIEAMKLMNEIEAKGAGRIAKILVENAQPVEYGQTLFLVEPLR